MPGLTPLVMPRVKHALWCELAAGSPSLARARAADTRSVECAGAHLLPPGHLVVGAPPAAAQPSTLHYPSSESRSQGERVLAGNHKEPVITVGGFAIQPATLVTEVFVAPGICWLVETN